MPWRLYLINFNTSDRYHQIKRIYKYVCISLYTVFFLNEILSILVSVKIMRMLVTCSQLLTHNESSLPSALLYESFIKTVLMVQLNLFSTAASLHLLQWYPKKTHLPFLVTSTKLFWELHVNFFLSHKISVIAHNVAKSCTVVMNVCKQLFHMTNILIRFIYPMLWNIAMWMLTIEGKSIF